VRRRRIDRPGMVRHRDAGARAAGDEARGGAAGVRGAVRAYGTGFQGNPPGLEPLVVGKRRLLTVWFSRPRVKAEWSWLGIPNHDLTAASHGLEFQSVTFRPSLYQRLSTRAHLTTPLPGSARRAARARAREARWPSVRALTPSAMSRIPRARCIVPCPATTESPMQQALDTALSARADRAAPPPGSVRRGARPWGRRPPAPAPRRWGG